MRARYDTEERHKKKPRSQQVYANVSDVISDRKSTNVIYNKNYFKPVGFAEMKKI